MTDQSPANWHPDPFHRHDLRYWDGATWTEHVVTRGAQTTDPPIVTPPVVASPAPAAVSPAPIVASTAPIVAKPNKKVQREVRNAGVVAGEQVGGGTLLTEPVLVVNQRSKLIEVNAQYDVYDQHGLRVGAIQEYGQNLVKKASGLDTFGTRRFRIMDASGSTVLSMIAPVSLFLAKMIVLNADGTEAGRIEQKLGLLNVRLNLVARGEKVGAIQGEGWDTWNFSVQDAVGSEIARITKKWAGYSREMFTNSDNYVLELHGVDRGTLAESCRCGGPRPRHGIQAGSGAGRRSCDAKGVAGLGVANRLDRPSQMFPRSKTGSIAPDPRLGQQTHQSNAASIGGTLILND